MSTPCWLPPLLARLLLLVLLCISLLIIRSASCQQENVKCHSKYFQLDIASHLAHHRKKAHNRILVSPYFQHLFKPHSTTRELVKPVLLVLLIYVVGLFVNRKSFIFSIFDLFSDALEISSHAIKIYCVLTLFKIFIYCSKIPL